jgi:hypothetical protein
MVRETTKEARQHSYAKFLADLEAYVEYRLLRKILLRKIVNYYKEKMRNEEKRFIR